MFFWLGYLSVALCRATHRTKPLRHTSDCRKSRVALFALDLVTMIQRKADGRVAATLACRRTEAKSAVPAARERQGAGDKRGVFR